MHTSVIQNKTASQSIKLGEYLFYETPQARSKRLVDKKYRINEHVKPEWDDQCDGMIWDTYADFSCYDLMNAKVSYNIKYSWGEVSGIGLLLCYQRPEGLIALEVRVFQVDNFGQIAFERRLIPDQETRFILERHEDHNVATFRLSSCKNSNSVIDCTN